MLFLMLMLMSFVMISCTNPSVPAGHEGYVIEKPRIWGNGGYQAFIQGPSNYGISIWRNEVETIDIRPATHSEVFHILTKDELNIAFKFQTIMKINPGSVKDVVEKYSGKDSYERFIKEPLRSMIRESVQIYDSRTVKEKRTQIGLAVMTKIKKYLEGTPFVVMSVAVGNIDYPKIVTNAVEKKLASKQLLEEKETQREIAKKNAEIRIENARGIAEAQKIINSTLTKNYLQHEAIDAQKKMANSPNHTTVYIPSGANGIPIVRTIR